MSQEPLLSFRLQAVLAALLTCAFFVLAGAPWLTADLFVDIPTAPALHASNHALPSAAREIADTVLEGASLVYDVPEVK